MEPAPETTSHHRRTPSPSRSCAPSSNVLSMRRRRKRRFATASRKFMRRRRGRDSILKHSGASSNCGRWTTRRAMKPKPCCSFIWMHLGWMGNDRMTSIASLVDAFIAKQGAPTKFEPGVGSNFDFTLPIFPRSESSFANLVGVISFRKVAARGGRIAGQF